MKKHLKKIIPSKVVLEKQKILKPIAHWIAEPKIWHFNRRAIAAGVAIGLFFGSLPIAGQMLLSAAVAVFLKSNMPIAIVATWISNPITMPFIFTGNYYFGAWLLKSPKIDLENVTWTLDSMMSLGGNILIPLYFGSIVVGIILAMLSIIIIRLLWRISIIIHFHERKNRRQQ